MVLGVGVVVLVHLTTGGVGFGWLSPAFAGITAAVAGVGVMLALGPRARVARSA
jgi:hypothetical protein